MSNLAAFSALLAENVTQLERDLAAAAATAAKHRNDLSVIQLWQNEGGSGKGRFWGGTQWRLSDGDKEILLDANADGVSSLCLKGPGLDCVVRLLPKQVESLRGYLNAIAEDRVLHQLGDIV